MYDIYRACMKHLHVIYLNHCLCTDSIAYEYVYGLYPGNFSAALLDHNSQEFRVAAWEFCGGVCGMLLRILL